MIFPEPVSVENDKTVDGGNATTSMSASGETVATKPISEVEKGRENNKNLRGV